MCLNVADEHVQELAVSFRGLVERCDKSNLQLHIQRFPCGSCGDVCWLLARFLADREAPGFHYFCGSRRKPERRDSQISSHAWLQHGDLIVDITADQFIEIDGPIIITRLSDWHAELDGEDKGVADYRERYRSEPGVLANFEEAYERIVVNSNGT